jgi:hypothetical protein
LRGPEHGTSLQRLVSVIHVDGPDLLRLGDLLVLLHNVRHDHCREAHSLHRLYHTTVVLSNDGKFLRDDFVVQRQQLDLHDALHDVHTRPSEYRNSEDALRPDE